MKYMNTISAQEAKQKIQDLKNGTIYSVTFVKKDGSIRLMNSIKGTKRGVTGVGLRFDPKEKDLLPVYDLQAAKKDPENPNKAWRMVNLSTLMEVTFEGTKFQVTQG
jgi:hypothetical protein